MKNFPNTTLELALYYASLGYMVFPCHSVVEDGSCTCRRGRKCPDSRAAKHPRTKNGRKDATTNLAEIEAWWTKWPEANLAIATGRTSGIFVLDVDGRNGGNYTLENLEETYRNDLKGGFESVSATQTSITGSGGKHFIFRYPYDFSIPGGSNLIGPGLDICSDGQHIIAPPSLHKSGNRYRWHGQGVAPIEAPNWLIYEILQHSTTPCKSETATSDPTRPSSVVVTVIEDGARNSTLFRHASGLVNTYSRAETRRRIEDMNNRLCNPPLEREEVETILQSVEKYRPSSPSLST